MTMLMTDLTILHDDEYDWTQVEDMGSFNHSYFQAKLATIFFSMERFIALTELTLDASPVKDQFAGLVGETLIPDVSVYPDQIINVTQDQTKATNMPELIIEILSPMQVPQILIDKVAVYFALGVKSCWIVYPVAKTISVFSAPHQFESFSSGAIIDKSLDIRLPLERIFG